MEEFSFLLKLLVESIDTFIAYLEELLDDLPEEIALGQFTKDLHIYIRDQINKFFILRCKEEGYEAVTVLPIFGKKGEFIPVNKIRAKHFDKLWSDEEDWDTDVKGIDVQIETTVKPKAKKVGKCRLIIKSGRRFDLKQAFRTIPVEQGNRFRELGRDNI